MVDGRAGNRVAGTLGPPCPRQRRSGCVFSPWWGSGARRHKYRDFLEFGRQRAELVGERAHRRLERRRVHVEAALGLVFRGGGRAQSAFERRRLGRGRQAGRVREHTPFVFVFAVAVDEDILAGNVLGRVGVDVHGVGGKWR